MLPQANAVSANPAARRTSPSGLQCGGSDGYSGFSANPALGAAVDLLVTRRLGHPERNPKFMARNTC